MATLTHKVCTVSKSNLSLLTLHMNSANVRFRIEKFERNMQAGYRIFIDPDDLTNFKLDVLYQYQSSIGATATSPGDKKFWQAFDPIFKSR